MEKDLSRKLFFKTAAKYAAGATAGVAGFNIISSNESRAESTVPWPWPYSKLDVENSRKIAHKSYYDAGCCYAGFIGIVEPLQQLVGAPFTSIPPEMMIYGGGGVAGWGTICGALNGAAAAINLVSDRSTQSKLINELVGWYTQVNLPTDMSNQYAVDHEFLVDKCDVALPQNSSGSPLCHVSVTEWCLSAISAGHSDYDVSSTERKDRCARLAGDVVAYAVELLNNQYDGNFTGLYVQPESVSTCQGCHGSTALDNVAAKMECGQCHSKPAAHTVASVHSDERGMDAPHSFDLQQNYPNPFNPDTRIQFSLPKRAKVNLTIYDVHGRTVRTLIYNQEFEQGVGETIWNGTNNFGTQVASGIYFYKLQAGNFVETKKMTLVK